MESDDQSSIDSEEEAEKLKLEVYDTQKMIQQAGVTEEEDLVKRLNGKPDSDQEDDQKVDPAPQGSHEREILEAAEKGKLEEIQRLLKENIGLIGAQDQDGYTPLHRACYSNHTKIVEALVQDNSVLTDFVQFLLQTGANVNARTCDGWTPLHSACKWNNFNCVAMLLDYGSEVNPLTNGGQTPLHLAASHAEAKETLFLLLSNPKICLNIRNQTGELAYDIAHRHCKYYKLFDLCDPCFNII